MGGGDGDGGVESVICSDNMAASLWILNQVAAINRGIARAGKKGWGLKGLHVSDRI